MRTLPLSEYDIYTNLDPSTFRRRFCCLFSLFILVVIIIIILKSIY